MRLSEAERKVLAILINQGDSALKNEPFGWITNVFNLASKTEFSQSLIEKIVRKFKALDIISKGKGYYFIPLKSLETAKEILKNAEEPYTRLSRS